MINKKYKKAKAHGKRTLTKIKALPTHPAYRAVEDATLGGYKQALDDSKKLSKGSVFSTPKGKKLKKSKAYGIKSAVWGGNI